MEVLFHRHPLTANQVMEALPGSPGNATVCKLLRILEEKGQIENREEAGTFLYSPKESPRTAAKGALRKLVQTFFEGNLSEAVAMLIDADEKLTEEELDRLQWVIEEARSKGAPQGLGSADVE